jgi:hypothetical protein
VELWSLDAVILLRREERTQALTKMKRINKNNRFIPIDLLTGSETRSLTCLPVDMKRMLRVQWREFVHELEDVEEWKSGKRGAKQNASTRYNHAA